MNNLVIYTDGGCSGNPGPGGWGTVIIDGTNITKLSGGEKQTTNNRMELSAAINALDAVVKNTGWRNRHVEVYSDSQYVKNGITSWIKNWKKNYQKIKVLLMNTTTLPLFILSFKCTNLLIRSLIV